MPFVRFRRFLNHLVAFPIPQKLCGKRMHFVREKRDKPPGRRFHAEKRLSEKRDKDLLIRGLLVLDGQPEGRASTARLLCVSGECAEGGKLFERSIDAFAIDVAIEETADLIP